MNVKNVQEMKQSIKSVSMFYVHEKWNVSAFIVWFICLLIRFIESTRNVALENTNNHQLRDILKNR